MRRRGKRLNSTRKGKRGGSAKVILVGVITLGDVVNSLGSRLDLISILVGDLDGELLFDGHDNLDGIQ